MCKLDIGLVYVAVVSSCRPARTSCTLNEAFDFFSDPGFRLWCKCQTFVGRLTLFGHRALLLASLLSIELTMKISSSSLLILLACRVPQSRSRSYSHSTPPVTIHSQVSPELLGPLGTRRAILAKSRQRLNLISSERWDWYFCYVGNRTRDNGTPHHLSATNPHGCTVRLHGAVPRPVRYGPRDARRAVQFGLGFKFWLKKETKESGKHRTARG